MGNRGNKWEKLGRNDRKVGNHGKFWEKLEKREITFTGLIGCLVPGQFLFCGLWAY